MSRVVTWVLILACLQIFALLARDASAAELPPGQLPDARAYEQVTPIQKNGLDVASGMSSIQAAADGSAITYASNGGIAGGTGAQQYPLYIARRGSTEWKTAGLLPPAATGPSALLYGWNPNLSEAYVGQAGSRAAPGTLYQSDTATTSRLGVATGGPIEDFRWIGSSQEGGVVLFETNGATLTPEARTGAANAYVWDRATGTIRLAGVSNAGDSFADGSFGGPYNWYFENPLESGAGRGEAFYSGEENDISSDGSRVFVTAAATGQIFLRENPTREQSPLTREGECAYPALACTVQISASQKRTAAARAAATPTARAPRH